MKIQNDDLKLKNEQKSQDDLKIMTLMAGIMFLLIITLSYMVTSDKSLVEELDFYQKLHGSY